MCCSRVVFGSVVYYFSLVVVRVFVFVCLVCVVASNLYSSVESLFFLACRCGAHTLGLSRSSQLRHLPPVTSFRSSPSSSTNGSRTKERLRSLFQNSPQRILGTQTSVNTPRQRLLRMTTIKRWFTISRAGIQSLHRQYGITTAQRHPCARTYPNRRLS